MQDFASRSTVTAFARLVYMDWSAVYIDLHGTSKQKSCFFVDASRVKKVFAAAMLF